jgi:D-3-phosphoglycerate dehydrogenase / 2-oxoglutarate reductase
MPIAMMFALARQTARRPMLDSGRQVGEEPLHGRRITGKTLGIIGCGNIGSIVADRAIGLKMRVIAYDPFLSSEHARRSRRREGGTGRAFRRADFITLHTPLTDRTEEHHRRRLRSRR